MSVYYIETIFHSDLSDDAIDYGKKKAKARIGEQIVMEVMAMSPATVVIKETMSSGIYPGEQRHRIDTIIRNSEEANLRRALEKACGDLGSLIGFIECPSTSPDDCSPWAQKPDMICGNCWLQYLMEEER